MDYQNIVGVIHSLMAIMFFIMVIINGFPSGMVLGPKDRPLINKLYMVRNSVCFLTSRLQMVECVTSVTGVGG